MPSSARSRCRVWLSVAAQGWHWLPALPSRLPSATTGPGAGRQHANHAAGSLRYGAGTGPLTRVSYDLGSTTLVTTQRCLPILRSRMNPSFS